jgi:hypothetical protein
MAELPHMPTKEEILAKAIELFQKDLILKGLPVITPEESELKEANFFEKARAELMTGIRSELEKYLSDLESEADTVRADLGIEKPLPTSERLTELENKLARVEERYKTTKERLKEAEEELRKIREAKPLPPPKIKSYDELKRGFEGKDPVDALAIFVSRYRVLQSQYLLEDLHRFLGELKTKLTNEDIFRFYKVYPNLKLDFVSIASLISWIPPPPPPPAGLTEEDKTRLEDLFKRIFLEAGVSYVGRLPAFRDELRTIQETYKDIPHPEAIRLAEIEVKELAARLIPYKPPPPIPVPVPITAVPIRVAMAEERVRRIEQRMCLMCREYFTIDLDLMRRVSESTTEIRGAGRVHHEPSILEFPERFYHMCPNCRFEQFGYRDIYDALAYLLAEATRSNYKKVKLTKDKLRAVGLDKMDMDEIQTLEARYRVSSS